MQSAHGDADTFLELRGVEKRFGANTVVRSLDLEVMKGEFVSILGGSGCGKTTTLRMIAGFEYPSLGTIRIDGQEVTDLPASRRRIGMVFQHYALFPNMTVRENIGFGLKVAKRPAADISERVDRMLELIHMKEFGARFPHQLSGGQQQRVALARALAIEPRLLLLDEPLSALDAKIRASLRVEIRAIQRELGITTIYVTHDQEEALSISDRVVVMREGLVEQVDTPLGIYNRPANAFVASFIGTLNRIKAIEAETADGTMTVAGQPISVPGRGPSGRVPGARRELEIAVRPEAIRAEPQRYEDTSISVNGTNVLRGTLRNVFFLGATIRLSVQVGDQQLFADTFNDPGAMIPEPGSTIRLEFPKSACIVLSNG